LAGIKREKEKRIWGEGQGPALGSLRRFRPSEGRGDEFQDSRREGRWPMTRTTQRETKKEGDSFRKKRI